MLMRPAMASVMARDHRESGPEDAPRPRVTMVRRSRSSRSTTLRWLAWYASSALSPAHRSGRRNADRVGHLADVDSHGWFWPVPRRSRPFRGSRCGRDCLYRSPVLWPSDPADGVGQREETVASVCHLTASAASFLRSGTEWYRAANIAMGNRQLPGWPRRGQRRTRCWTRRTSNSQDARRTRGGEGHSGFVSLCTVMG